MLLFTGKGGVGKTSVAAATAVHAARAGARVLVTSTDPAHSLADVLDAPLGDGPSGVDLDLDLTTGDAALFAQQLDAHARLETHWGAIRDYLVELLAWGGIGEVAAEELLLLPGLEEIFSLLELRAQVASDRYDLIVVDCAPTAETLGLLALPEALRWYVERVLAPGRRVARAVGPLVRSLGGEGVPLPDADTVGHAGRLGAALAEVHTLLSDPGRTSVRLVMNAERLVIAESQRTATALSLLGYAADAVVVNRLLPEAVADPYLAGWKDRQAEHLAAIRSGFAPVPVLTAPLLMEEPIGVGALADLGCEVYAGRDPRSVLHSGVPVRLEHDPDGDAVLVVAVPFASRDDVTLHRRAGEVTVEIGGVRRNLHLPAALRRREVTGAAVVDGELRLRFAPAPVPAELP